MIIGITGGIATGKTTFSNLFREKGFEVIDADLIAKKKLVENKNELIGIFGCEVITNEKINYQMISEVIFNNEDKRKELNSLIHPLVKKEIIKIINDSQEKMIIVDVPLLFEAKFDDLCDYIVCVYTNKAIQVKRLMKRNNYNKEEALKRINAQMKIEEKIKKSNFIINNSFDEKYLLKEFDLLLDKLKELK